jgi:hypothetical protein
VNLHEVAQGVVDAFELDRLEVPKSPTAYLTDFSCVQMRSAKARRFWLLMMASSSKEYSTVDPNCSRSVAKLLSGLLRLWAMLVRL